MRRKVNILIAVVVFITAGVIGVLQYQKETGWRRLGRQEETWNTRESMDTSKARLRRYEKLKKDYFPEDRPRGVAVWEETVPACTLEEMYNSDLCAVVTVTAGYEENKNYLEAEVENYLYDHTGRYADHLLIKEAVPRAWVFYGRIPANPGQRMVVFLDVDEYGICVGKLIWNYFVTEDGYVVPMTEDYDDGREEDYDYVGMWDYGGYSLEDYLAVLETGYNRQESRRRKEQAIYDYLGQSLELSVIQEINGPQLVSSWEIISEEKRKGTERYRLIALAEELWIQEILQQAVGSRTLTLKREGNDYMVLSDTIVWDSLSEDISGYQKEQIERLEKLAWENYERWKEQQREQTRYERICGIKEVKPVGISSWTEPRPLKPADHEGMMESEQVKLTLEYPEYPLGTGRIYGFLENTSEAIIYYDSPQVEIWKDNAWYRVPYQREIGQLLVQPALPAKTEIGFGENLRNWDYDFPQGKYRIVLYYDRKDGRPAYEKTYDHMVCAEFELRADVALPKFGRINEQSRKEKQAVKRSRTRE